MFGLGAVRLCLCQIFLEPASQPLFVHEGMRIFKALEQFKKAPVRLATIVNEYGSLEGTVTQTDLLEAIAGEAICAEVEGEEPDVVEREDGSLLIDGMMSAQEAFDRLNLQTGLQNTIAGFMLQQLGHLPKLGEHFDYEGWRHPHWPSQLCSGLCRG
jgi:putative hemolysin